MLHKRLKIKKILSQLVLIFISCFALILSGSVFADSKEDKNNNLIESKNNKEDKALTKDDSFTIDLLENNNEELAIKYYKKTGDGGNKLYITKDGNYTSDIVVAMENNMSNYILEVLPNVNNINSTFKYNDTQNMTLFMVFSMHPNINNKDKIYDLFIEKNTDVNLKNINGLNAFDIANKYNNYFFKEYYIKKIGGEKISLLFENDPLTVEEKNNQKKIIENLKNGLLEDIVSKGKEVEYFTKYIVRGYNDAADIILPFVENINDKNEDGLTPLMASSISTLNGGNVEYAKKLIEYGVDINLTNNEVGNVTPLSFALVRDNYKVVTLLIVNNVKYDLKDDNGLNSFDYALKYDAVKSSIILNSMLKK